ncbi:tripeptide aminopeptidase [Pseudorhizobium tarimense]|uniref:Peptidase T n=1 Tax=Pseudorhizobium tarimense TaxID=1079109 RepID=A0ABV2H449_9HYPH|nr:peptidase T [Pseudorhizobium tarimense]MCJ8518302.1 peptidase T [Pseudorhizobium tarimense]
MPLPNATVLDRFLRYVVIDTQSNAASTSQPSTEKQKNLGRLLEQELRALGLDDAHLDEHGNVYATIPANTEKAVATICFCAHMDTAPDFTGTGVKPQIVRNYQGGDINLVGDPNQVIKVEEHPELKAQLGHDIVTTDGTTLLGADDKAGIAEIMTAAQFLLAHPEIKHGPIKLLFTTDEEIGRGADKVDLEKLGADFGYTLDGSTVGEIQSENFSADGVTIEISGVPIHPGTAKGKMENAIKIASAIVARLPQDQAPETTEGREGFIHPISICGAMEGAKISFIIRDFEEDGLTQKEDLLKTLTEEVLAAYPGSTYRFEVKQQYRNMKEVLNRHPEVMENLMEATRRIGLEPKIDSIRGGTDGARLSFMGLPCPNIYTGGHAYHSPLEWISVQDMETSVRAIVELVKVWEERAA